MLEDLRQWADECWEADKKAAAAVRTKEAADYHTAHKDYTETIDAIAQAVQVLKAEAAKGPRQQAGAGTLQKPARASTFLQRSNGTGRP